MQIHDLAQGSNAWCQFRLEHFGASEAAAMLGLSKKVKRTELLHMKHTGTAKEFSDWVQTNIMDYGHQVEALARPLVEKIAGDDLYPVTCSDGYLSASCDGLTLAEDIAFEHKQWNAELAASVAAGVLPEEHMPQCQQVLMVTGAEKLLFVVSDGTPDKFVWMEIFPDQEWFARIRAGWAQFAKDLAIYEPTVYTDKPVAEAIMQLPALAIQIKGEVVKSNLPMFQAAAERFIDDINTDLKTDEDFVAAEATVKFCKATEDDLEAAKDAAIKQTASVDELMRTVDFIKEKLRAKRLTLEKLVKSQKELIKDGILATARLAFSNHMTELESEIKPIRLACPQPDFAGAMKSKRTLASLQDAVNTELANAKIAADAVGKDLRAKLTWCKANADGYGFLFNDLQQIIYKETDDFQLVINTRIGEHKRAEAEKLEKQRKAIQEEEQAKAELAAAEKTRLAQIESDRVANEQAEAARKAQQMPAEIAEAVPAVTSTPHAAMEPGRAPEAYQFPTRSALTTAAPTLTLGKIGTRLGFSLTADFLRTIGFEPAGRERAAVLYHENDWQAICAALITHISHASELQQQAA